jgi:tetratricopeptide (TPR) repeat protein
MSLTARNLGGTLFAAILLSSPLLAQAPLEGRPEILNPGPLTREELERRKAEDLVREARTLFGLGVMRQRGDRWLEAVKLLEEAAKLDTESAAPHRALIPLYLSLAREEDALDACRKVLERDPADAEAAYQLAKLLKADGRAREAIAVLDKGARSRRIEDRPELLYAMLDELAGLQEKAAEFPAAATTYRRLAKHLIDKRAALVGSEALTPEKHAEAVAHALERAGRCCVADKKYAEAVAAFEQARDFLEKQPDAETRLKAVRLGWNIAQVCLAREEWAEALTYLDAYLEHSPDEAEPYEKKVLAQRKLNREHEILPALKKYAGRAPDALGVQLLYAKELGRDPKTRREAENLYLALGQKFPNADVYRGLFKLYQFDDKMIDVLNLVDKVFATVASEDDIDAVAREAARERGRAMLHVLKSEPPLVAALLPVALKEVRGQQKRHVETWRLLAVLAARVKQLDKAEVLFRQCLAQAPASQEPFVYSALIEVLSLQKKYEAIINLCKDALDGPRKADATNQLLFRRSLALALAETDKTDEALAELERALKAASEAGKVDLRCRKAQILARAGQFDPAVSECEAMLKELTQSGELKQVRVALSAVYTQKGDHEKSDAQLQKILEDDPNDALANNNLGYQWADRNRNLDEAERMIRKAIEIDHLERKNDLDDEADNAAYLDSLGWVLFRKGKLDEARDWLEKAAALPQGADDPTVWDHLGDVYHQLKQPAKAKQSWQMAVKLYETDRRGKGEGRLDEAKRKLKMLSD